MLHFIYFFVDKHWMASFFFFLPLWIMLLRAFMYNFVAQMYSFNSLGCKPGCGITGSCGDFEFLRNCQLTSTGAVQSPWPAMRAVRVFLDWNCSSAHSNSSCVHTCVYWGLWSSGPQPPQTLILEEPVSLSSLEGVMATCSFWTKITKREGQEALGVGSGPHNALTSKMREKKASSLIKTTREYPVWGNLQKVD